MWGDNTKEIEKKLKELKEKQWIAQYWVQQTLKDFPTTTNKKGCQIVHDKNMEELTELTHDIKILKEALSILHK